MELDELKRTWERYDKRLDASVRLNSRMMRGLLLDKAETAMTRLSLLLGVELVVLLGAALWLGSFMWKHADETRFLIPAAMLDVGVIVLVIVSVHQIASISQLDYSASVVAIQTRLESLRVERIRVTKWTLLLACFAWTPLSIVFLKDVLDLDVYTAFGGLWVGANILFGLLVLVVGAWIARRLAVSVKHASWLQQLSRDVAGHNLTAAMDFLGSLSQFEKEERGAA